MKWGKDDSTDDNNVKKKKTEFGNKFYRLHPVHRKCTVNIKLKRGTHSGASTALNFATLFQKN